MSPLGVRPSLLAVLLLGLAACAGAGGALPEPGGVELALAEATAEAAPADEAESSAGPAASELARSLGLRGISAPPEPAAPATEEPEIVSPDPQMFASIEDPVVLSPRAPRASIETPGLIAAGDPLAEALQEDMAAQSTEPAPEPEAELLGATSGALPAFAPAAEDAAAPPPSSDDEPAESRQAALAASDPAVWLGFPAADHDETPSMEAIDAGVDEAEGADRGKMEAMLAELESAQTPVPEGPPAPQLEVVDASLTPPQVDAAPLPSPVAPRPMLEAAAEPAPTAPVAPPAEPMAEPQLAMADPGPMAAPPAPAAPRAEPSMAASSMAAAGEPDWYADVKVAAAADAPASMTAATTAKIAASIATPRPDYRSMFAPSGPEACERRRGVTLCRTVE